MSDKKINLEDIIIQEVEYLSKTNKQEYTLFDLKRCMKEAVRQALELAAENATLDNTVTKCPENKNQDYISHYIPCDDYSPEYWITVDKQSIFDVINLIE